MCCSCRLIWLEKQNVCYSVLLRVETLNLLTLVLLIWWALQSTHLVLTSTTMQSLLVLLCLLHPQASETEISTVRCGLALTYERSLWYFVDNYVMYVLQILCLVSNIRQQTVVLFWRYVCITRNSGVWSILLFASKHWKVSSCNGDCSGQLQGGLLWSAAFLIRTVSLTCSVIIWSVWSTLNWSLKSFNFLSTEWLKCQSGCNFWELLPSP